VFDSGSVWYKHLGTGEVKECGGGVYPGVQIRRRACGKTLIGVGYTEVEKCKAAAAGSACVTDDEMNAQTLSKVKMPTRRTSSSCIRRGGSSDRDAA